MFPRLMKKGAVWPLVVKMQKNFPAWKYFLLPLQHFITKTLKDHATSVA